MRTNLAALSLVAGLALVAAACAMAPAAAPATATATKVIVAAAVNTAPPVTPVTKEAAPATAVMVAATAIPTGAPTAAVQAVTSTLTPMPMLAATATQPPSPVATATQPSSPVAAAGPATPTPAATATATAGVPPSKASLTVNGQGITYSYPNGWRLKQETKNNYSQMSLEAPEPEAALLSLTIYGMDMQPRQLSASLLDAMQKLFAGATATPITGTIAGYPAEGYTLAFTVQGVPMTGTILSFRGDKASFTWYTQAANEDMPAVQPGFDLVRNTLVVK